MFERSLLAVGSIVIMSPLAVQVNVPKQRKTFCKACKCHTQFKVTQYKAGKASLYAQGKLLETFSINLLLFLVLPVRQEKVR